MHGMALWIIPVEKCSAVTSHSSSSGSNNQSEHIYIVPCVAGKSEAHSGRVFTFTVGNVKQLSFQSTLKVLGSSESAVI